MAVRRGLEGPQIRVKQRTGNGHFRRVSWNCTIINLAEGTLFCRMVLVRPVRPGGHYIWDLRGTGDLIIVHGQVAFDQEPLAAVAAEFNRYGAVPIEIETPSLNTLVISGVFAADDTETFLAFLRTLDDVTVETTSTQIRVFRHSMLPGERVETR